MRSLDKPCCCRRSCLTAMTCVLILFSTIPFAMHSPLLSFQKERETASKLHLPRSFSTFLRIRSAQKSADQTNAKHLKQSKGAKSHFPFSSSSSHEEGGLKEGCEATIMIIRHCEKGNIKEHCSYEGFERSVFLASLFGNSDNERWPLPDHIFALGPGDRNNPHRQNFREIETVGPLAKKAGLDIDASYSMRNKGDLVEDTLINLRAGLYCGKLIVVSWKHSEIPLLANHLGCGPFEGCPLDYDEWMFDNVWQIKYVYRPLAHSEKKNLRVPNTPEWRVYGSVQAEGFDPLATSKQYGDYPRGGTSIGMRWSKDLLDVDERPSPKKEELTAVTVDKRQDGQ